MYAKYPILLCIYIFRAIAVQSLENTSKQTICIYSRYSLARKRFKKFI